MQATARAPSNIALVKYWGKRDGALNVPATGSISVTLAGLETVTTVAFEEGLDRDRVTLDGVTDPAGAERVARFLDLVRETAGATLFARVETENNFPTGAGLASSASGFAALAAACDSALDLGLAQDELSALARRGSGSAARSVIDGFAEMLPGSLDDGTDAYAEQVGPPELCPMEVVVAVTTTAPKTVGSTDGMLRSERTSPYYLAWLAETERELEHMRDALLEKDLARVGALAEQNALRMHGVMLGAEPPLLYWNGATVEIMSAVWAMRDEGLPVWFTIDAGPQVKVITADGGGDAVEARLRTVPGVTQVLRSRPGDGARVTETDQPGPDGS